jgi:tetratricopeptide (TPR) repeat protein
MNDSLMSFKVAVKCYEDGRLDEAEKICHQICDSKVNKPEPYNLLAIIKARNGQPDFADQYFKTALDLAPNRADIHANYARALFDYNAIEQASSAVARSLSLNPNQPETWYLSGLIQLRKEDYSAALESFHRALNLNPTLFSALIQVSRIYHGVDKKSEALKYLIKAEQCVPDTYGALLQLGYLQKRLMRDQQSFLSFKRAFLLNPDSEEARYQKASVDPAWKEPLEGKHLVLRPHEPKDAAFLNRCFRDETFMNQYNRFTPRDKSEHQLENEISKNCQQHPWRSRRMDWILIKKRTHEPIGLAALAEIQFNHLRAEFLIGIPDSHQRHNGAALEGSLLVMDMAFNRVALSKLTMGVYGPNSRAQKNAMALGFIQEGHFENHIFLKEKGEFLDLYANGMTEQNFRKTSRLKKLSMRLLGRDITHVE